VPVPDAEPSPPPEQLGEHAVGAGAIAGELERPLEPSRRALAPEDDDVRLADLESSRVGVLDPSPGREIPRGEDRVDRPAAGPGVDETAVAADPHGRAADARDR